MRNNNAVNIIGYSNPNNRSDEILRDMQWTRMQSSRLNYLNIGEQLEMRDGLYAERYNKWAELFPISDHIGAKDSSDSSENSAEYGQNGSDSDESH